MCQISENSYERILRSLSNARTHGGTYGCEFIGSARYRGEPIILGLVGPNLPLFGPNQHFGLYLLHGLLNFADFLYKNLSYGFLLEN